MEKKIEKLAKQPFLSLINQAEKLFIEEIPSQGKSRHFFVSLRANEGTHSESPSERTTEDILDNASILLGNKDYLLARQLYSLVLKRNLRQPEALKGLGICLLRLGDPAAARKCFRALWDINQDERAMIWLSQCFAAEKDDRMALEWFKKINNAANLPETDRFEFYKEKGNCCFRLGDFVEAESNYLRAIEIRPESDAVYANLGTLEIQREKLENAASYFEKALRFQPDNAKAHSGLGIIAFKSQDYGLSSRFLIKALDSDPQNTVALFQLIECASHTPIYAELCSRIKKFLDKEPNHLKLRFSLAALHYRAKNWKEAEIEIEKVLSLDPQHGSARRLREELASHRLGN